MAENNARRREEIFSKAVRAGKRTYFFDVKSTRKGEYYLTITESKRKFNNEQGKFYYEKFKLFLYKEDFEKFENALEETIKFIVNNQQPLNEDETTEQEQVSQQAESNPDEKQQEETADNSSDGSGEDPFNTSIHTDVDFDDLGDESKEQVEQQKYYDK